MSAEHDEMYLLTYEEGEPWEPSDKHSIAASLSIDTLKVRAQDLVKADAQIDWMDARDSGVFGDDPDHTGTYTWGRFEINAIEVL